MSWREITLGDEIEIKHGFAFKSQYYADSGRYVLLTPGNCFERGGLRLKGNREKYYIGAIPDEFVLSTGDLIVVMTDLVSTAPILGGAFLIPEDDKFLHNQRLGLVRFKSDNLDKRFLYFLLNTQSYRGQVRGSASGATVRHTAPKRIYQCKVRIPAKATQTRIADILSAYDDLIENNRRRIALLEQAARELYREWFVRLRFPGHEHAKIVDGVPKGWKRTALGNIGQLKYGKALKADDRIEGEFSVYGSSGIVGTHDEAHVEGPGIIVGRKGNVGSVYWSDESFCAIDTVYFFEPSAVTLYVYYALQNVDFINTDVAVPGLNRNLAHSRKVLMPSEQARDAFDVVVAPLHKQISLLRKENESLVRARDLLLPRLMSGEVAV